jgi:hypothetical protein
MEEPPDQYRRGNHQQSEHLIATECATLKLAALEFGELLIVRLDAAFNHSLGRSDPGGQAPGTTHQYRFSFDWIGSLRCAQSCLT